MLTAGIWATRLASILSAYQLAHRHLNYEKQTNPLRDVEPSLWVDLVVLEFPPHRVYRSQRKTTPTAVAPQVPLIRHARNRVFAEDHRLPFIHHTATPDQDHVVRVDGCWVIEPLRAPVAGTGCRQQDHREA